MADDKLFDELLKQYGADELAQNHVFSLALTAREEQETTESLQEILRQRRFSINSEDRLRLNLMQLRFQIEGYLNEGCYDPKRPLGIF